MNQAERAALQQRLKRFSFDEHASCLTFARRLARENGWSAGYTRRVVDEYRKFLFLAATAQHVVSPSEDVDRAWHLHLTYTRSYWDELCGQCLRMELHHEPTRGGSDEARKYVGLYEQTLATYARTFGHDPPPDIWPAAERRFGEDTRARWVNVARHWVIKRPTWALPRFAVALAQRLEGAACGIAPLGLAAGGLAPLALVASPLDLRGPDFLILYAALFVIALTVTLAARARMRRTEAALEVDPYEACVLARDDRAAGTGALIHLLETGVLTKESSDQGTLLHTEQAPPADATNIELALFRAVRQGELDEDPVCLQDALSACREHEAELRAALENRGLLETHESFRAARGVALLSMGSLLLLGIAKLVVGASREKPVGLLVLALVVTIVALIALARRPLRTPAGERALARLRAASPTPGRACTENLAASDLVLLYALYGAQPFGDTPLAEDLTALETSTATGNDWSSALGVGCGGGGCDSGCGSGCGGCGGCGS